MAFAALEKIPGELPQERLLDLYENSPALHVSAVRLLGKRGDRKAMEVLERDIPTAYAQARFEVADAVWQIRSRLSMEAGPHPEAPRRLGKSKTWEDEEPLWEGFEKSLKSPNKAIRIMALGHLQFRAQRDGAYLPLLVDAARNGPDRAVRVKATQYLADAFRSQVHERQEKHETMEPVSSTFDALADIVANGDDDFAKAAFDATYHFRYFKGRPGYATVVKRVFDGLGSPNVAYRAGCLLAFVRLASENADLLERDVTPARRNAISDAVMAGLKSDYGRYKVDAIEAAGMLTLTEAVPDLTQIVSTASEWHCRMGAASALGKIGDPRAIEVLQQMADTDPYVDANGVYRNREVARRAVQAIRNRQTGAAPAARPPTSMPESRFRPDPGVSGPPVSRLRLSIASTPRAVEAGDGRASSRGGRVIPFRGVGAV
jgi:hypothetical protein